MVYYGALKNDNNMGNKSNIQWTDATWNIARGCTKVDADCKYCYMYRDSMNNTRYDPLAVVRTKTVFDFPLRYKDTNSECWDGNPLIFTSSLTDFFHEQIDEYRNEAWDIIRKCKHLTFQILTKRPERIINHLPSDWGNGWDNVWLGTSVGSQASADRISDLMKVRDRCKILFLSLEPMHSGIDITNKGLKDAYNTPTKFSDDTNCGDGYIGIDWVIVGGESGNESGKYRYRPCEIDWIQKVVDDCKKSSVPVFVKQLGTHLSKMLKLSDRHGGNIEEFPSSLRVRQFPNVSNI